MSAMITDFKIPQFAAAGCPVPAYTPKKELTGRTDIEIA
ncbi:hypothetical protein PSYMO_37302, partial [Pseudomonas amygdali pv. mori str. 301020]